MAKLLFVFLFIFFFTLPLFAQRVHGESADTAWVRSYSGPAGGLYWDEASAIAVDGSGNVYVTGKSGGSGTNYDYATINIIPMEVPPG